jgi:hypothetical protein
LNVQKVPRGPQEYDEVAERVLCRVKVVDCLDVETFGSVDVFEYFPVSACRRALKQGYEEAGYVQRYRVENHQAAKPLVELRRKYAYVGEKDCDLHKSDNGSEEQLARHAHLSGFHRPIKS